jgi:quinolinate synthase
VVACLETGSGEIHVAEPVRSQALGCIDRMLDFVARNPGSISQPRSGFVPKLGAA